jgi:subtilisin family serine protease
MSRTPIRIAAFSLSVALASCGGGGGGAHPPTSPTSTPTTSPASAYTCPTVDGQSSVAHVAAFRTPGDATHHAVARFKRTSPATALLAVTYDASAATRNATAIASNEKSAGATYVQSFAFKHANLTTRVISVPAAKQAAVEAAMRAQSGVKSVGPTGQRRHPSVVTSEYFPNDPYFNGFPAEIDAGNSYPATYHIGPYEETAIVPGQWDMHAIGLQDAFAYSQSGNGSGITSAGALGSSSVHIAIIDTGEDTTHPELTSKIVRQRCYVTDTNNVQSTSDITSDPDGHGTDVAGLAGEATNNDFGFTGTGGNVTLYGYRVYPEPDDNCTNDDNNDPQCGADTADIASAIEDAVSNGAQVISMSLGGGNCTTAGVDPDPVEQNAVADAIAAHVVVVAAAGNDGSVGGAAQPLEAPACDSGVIAVGASALDDGQVNGTDTGRGTPASPIEYVAYYSDAGSPGAAPKSSSAWGIVAPGGDPANEGNDNDNLHWIENIWTSTPYMSSSSDTTYEGNCAEDYPNDTVTSGNVDCRILIAGTSMATPHVAGAAALIISANPTYADPTKMKTLLCTTADDISDPEQGCGRLNVYRAMATALGDPVKP